MPKKPADKLRVPLNCLIAPATKTAIAGIQGETEESQGEIVDRSVALLAYGEEIKTEKFVEKAKRTVNHDRAPTQSRNGDPDDFTPAGFRKEPLLKPGAQKKARAEAKA